MSTASDLRGIFGMARPLVEQALDLTEEFAELREAASAKGLDWSQIKALVKAQVQDERDAGNGKRVNRIIEKADFASAYADMLGLGTKMNEKNNSVDSETAARVAANPKVRAALKKLGTPVPLTEEERAKGYSAALMSQDGTRMAIGLGVNVAQATNSASPDIGSLPQGEIEPAVTPACGDAEIPSSPDRKHRDEPPRPAGPDTPLGGAGDRSDPGELPPYLRRGPDNRSPFLPPAEEPHATGPP